MPEQREPIELKLVGGNRYGRYGKISQEQTINMIVSDGALVDYAGYDYKFTLGATTKGRGQYVSDKFDVMISIVGSQVFIIDKYLGKPIAPIGGLKSQSGSVFMAENNLGQVVITDYVDMYVIDLSTSGFTTLNITHHYGTIAFFNPGMVAFQNDRFIVAASGTKYWVLGEVNGDATSLASGWPTTAGYIGQLETKPDTVQGIIPMPGRGDLLLILGRSVGEFWTDVGGAIFPYQKNSSFNLDYGCVNPDSIAYQEDIVVFIGYNKKSNPMIMVSNGGNIQPIKNDGLSYELSQLNYPETCSGFLMRLDGHLIYQFTFPLDNKSFIYDFDSQELCYVTDEWMNYHPAIGAVYFQNDYYMLSYKDGDLYEFGTQFSALTYADNRIEEMPRIRILPPMRLPTQDYFIINWISVTIETGQPGSNGTNQAIELSISRDGGAVFGTAIRQDLPAVGKRQYRYMQYSLGAANDATMQFRFLGRQRFVVFNGVGEIYR